MSSHRQERWDEASLGLQSQRAAAAGGELTASLFSEDTGAVWRLGAPGSSVHSRLLPSSGKEERSWPRYLLLTL